MRNRPDKNRPEGVQAVILRCDGSLMRSIGPQRKEAEDLMKKGNLSPEETRRVEELGQQMGAAVKGCLAKALGLEGSDISLGVDLGAIGLPISLVAPAEETREITQDVLDKGLGLENIVLEETAKASATARLFKSPWSIGFAHGPDTLLPVAGLTEKLLKPGEKLRTLKRINWRSIMTNDLDLKVFEGELSDEQCEGCTLDGFFETDQGRKLSFFANQIAGSPIHTSRNENPIAKVMICNCKQHVPRRDWRGRMIAQLIDTAVSKGMIDMYETTAGVKFATLAELVAIMLAHSFKKDKKSGEIQLMAGINDLSLPDSLEDLTREGEYLRLKARPGKARTGKSGLEIIPFDFKLPNQKSPGTGIIAKGYSDEIQRKLLEIIASNQ